MGGAGFVAGEADVNGCREEAACRKAELRPSADVLLQSAEIDCLDKTPESCGAAISLSSY